MGNPSSGELTLLQSECDVLPPLAGSFQVVVAGGLSHVTLNHIGPRRPRSRSPPPLQIPSLYLAELARAVFDP